MAGEAQAADGAGGFLLPEPVHDAQGLGLVVAGLVQGVHQVKIEIVHAQTFLLVGKDALGLVQALALPQGQFGGQVKTFPGPFGNDPAYKGLALTAVVGVGGVKVVDARVPGGVEQGFGPGLVDPALRCGGKAHTPIAQQRGADRGVFPVAIFHSSLLRQRG